MKDSKISEPYKKTKKKSVQRESDGNNDRSWTGDPENKPRKLKRPQHC